MRKRNPLYGITTLLIAFILSSFTHRISFDKNQGAIYYWKNAIGQYTGQEILSNERLRTACTGFAILCEGGYLVEHVDLIFEGGRSIIGFNVKTNPLTGSPYPPDIQTFHSIPR